MKTTKKTITDALDLATIISEGEQVTGFINSTMPVGFSLTTQITWENTDTERVPSLVLVLTDVRGHRLNYVGYIDHNGLSLAYEFKKHIMSNNIYDLSIYLEAYIKKEYMNV